MNFLIETKRLSFYILFDFIMSYIFFDKLQLKI